MSMTASEEEGLKDTASSTILLDFEGNVLVVPSVPVESQFTSDGIQVNRVKPCTALPVCESTFTFAYLPLVGQNIFDPQTPCSSNDSPLPSWACHSTTPSKVSEFISTRRLKRWPVTMHDSDFSGDEETFVSTGSRESPFGSQWSRAVASLPVLLPDEHRSVSIRPRPTLSLHDSMYAARTGTSRISHMTSLKEDVPSFLDRGQHEHHKDKEFHRTTMKQ